MRLLIIRDYIRMHIYALMSGQLVLYVGKAVDPRNREYQHRSKHNTTASRHIPSYTEWNMKLLEECPIDVSRLREQYWMDELKPLYNELNAVARQSKNERVKEYQASDAFKNKKNTEEYKARRRETQRKYRAEKKAEKTRH